MANMIEIVERMRDVLSEKYEDKVLDKNIAYELGYAPDNLAAKKSRNLVPYDNLTLFCVRYKISTDWLFFGIGTKERSYAKEDL